MTERELLNYIAGILSGSPSSHVAEHTVILIMKEQSEKILDAIREVLDEKGN